MAIAFQDDGIRVAVNNLTAGELATAKLHLFVHGPTISNATTLGALTEASFSGYAAVTLSGWTSASVTAHVASSSANPITFTLSSGTASIGGWYVTDSASSLLYAAGNDLADPVAMSVTVNTYQVTLTVADAS